MSKELNKRKYKIKIDGKPPSNKQIDRHKNFESLLHNYKETTTQLYRKPLYKNPKAFLLVFFIAVVVWLVWNAFDEDSMLKKKANSVKKDTIGMMIEAEVPIDSHQPLWIWEKPTSSQT